ncbi:response regulator [Paenibacillus sp. NPDC058174]|uniref:response regulator transcription factor n=1 Tax=Paenibacillus sp. NPDC058174 TaxID=3346366 RepID=UPI0036D97543
MKLRMLIVDDEPIICMGLKETLPWHELDIEIAGEAYSGLEALAILEKEKVDLILSDIRMPEMDGLDLAAKLHEIEHPASFILLSGYEEFEYAKRAIQYNVKDYLIKPVDVDQLMRTVESVCRTIRAAREKQGSELRNQLEHRLRQLLMQAHEGVHDLALPEQELSFPVPYRLFASAVASYDQLSCGLTDEVVRQLHAAWQNRIEARLKGLGYETISVFVHPNLHFVYGYGSDDMQEEVFPQPSCTLEWNGSNIPLWVCESPAQTGLATLKNAYEQVVLQLKRLEIGIDGSSRERRQEADAVSAYPEALEKQVVETFFQQDVEQLRQASRELFLYLKENLFLLQESWKVCQLIKVLIYRRLKHVGVRVEEKDSYFTDADLFIYNSYASLERLYWDELMALQTIMNSSNVGKNRWVVNRVKEWIHQEFTQDLKASTIADRLHITPNYFSHIFKQETGKSYNTYLNDVRIETAKGLLRDTDMKIADIADRVGYNDYKYFVNVFKKTCGVSPSEYRETRYQ